MHTVQACREMRLTVIGLLRVNLNAVKPSFQRRPILVDRSRRKGAGNYKWKYGIASSLVQYSVSNGVPGRLAMPRTFIIYKKFKTSFATLPSRGVVVTVSCESPKVG